MAEGEGNGRVRAIGVLGEDEELEGNGIWKVQEGQRRREGGVGDEEVI